MKLHLKQDEIVAAIGIYLAEQGIRTSNKNISVTFTAGRKGSGLSAEVNIEDSPTTALEEPATAEEIASFNEIPVIAVSEIIGNAPQEALVDEVAELVTEDVVTNTEVNSPVAPIKTVSLFS